MEVVDQSRNGRSRTPLTLSGRYELGDSLGHGGMGEVRAGRDLRLSRDVAVKQLHPEMASQPMVRERFEAEARSAAGLVHPHVVAVFDSGEDGGIPFLVMERLAGRTLADAIDEGPLDPVAVRRLGVQVLDALTAAHGTGLIHRDIKPSNVLAAGPDNWKVGDFGIAKSVETADPSLTATGLIIGTPGYLAPERLAGAEATTSGDLYAVGVVLYEALVGHRGRDLAAPLAGFAQAVPSLDQIRPGLPPDLVAVITQAMDPDPAARFSTARQMAKAIAGETPLSPTTPTVPSPPDKIAETQVMHGPTALEPLALKLSRSLRQRRRVIGALIAALLIIAIVAAVSFGGRQSTSNPDTARSQAVPTQPSSSATTSLPAPLSAALDKLDQAVRP